MTDDAEIDADEFRAMVRAHVLTLSKSADVRGESIRCDYFECTACATIRDTVEGATEFSVFARVFSKNPRDVVNVLLEQLTERYVSEHRRAVEQECTNRREKAGRRRAEADALDASAVRLARTLEER